MSRCRTLWEVSWGRHTRAPLDPAWTPFEADAEFIRSTRWPVVPLPPPPAEFPVQFPNLPLVAAVPSWSITSWSIT